MKLIFILRETISSTLSVNFKKPAFKVHSVNPAVLIQNRYEIFSHKIPLLFKLKFMKLILIKHVRKKVSGNLKFFMLFVRDPFEQQKMDSKSIYYEIKFF